MGQQSDKPTPEEIKRAKEILAQENEKPGGGPSGGNAGIPGMILQMVQALPRPIIIGGLLIFLGWHAWDYYNAARRDPAETQEIMAKAATAQADSNAQNAPAGDDTVRGAAVRAEMEKLRQEAAAAKATTDALTQQINGLTAAEGLKRAELEKLANEAQTAGAEARAANALLMEQRKAELAKTRADARMAEWSADYVAGTMPNGRAKGDLFDAFGLNPKPAPAPARTQEASGGYVSSAPGTVIPPELKLRSCAYLNSDNSPAPQCTEILRLTQGQRVTATNDVGNGWVKISVQTNDGGTVVGFVNRKFLHFDGY